MGKLIKLFLILIVINFAIFAISDATGVDDFALYFFMLPVSVTVSVILFIIEAIRTSHKTYIAKDATQRKASRKRSLLIFVGIVIGLGIGWVILCFSSGYKIPGRDKHKNWPVFPGSSNPQVALKAIPDLYIYNLEPIKNTPYYAIFFSRDSIQFHDSSIGGQHLFGIIDKTGKIKYETDKSVSAYLDNGRIIIREVNYEKQKYPVTCDVIDTATLTLSNAQINAMPVPLTYDEFSEIYYKSDQAQADFRTKYTTDFYKNLQGIAPIEQDPVYGDSDSLDRGYGFYKDHKGNLYELDDYNNDAQLDALSPQVSGYKLKPGDYTNKTIAPNIKLSDKSIISDNEITGGISTSYGKPNGGRDGIFFSFYQTWLMYYTAIVGRNSTSFKLEGGQKDKPYITFYQLNQVKRDTDTLLFVADNRVWKVFGKR